MLPAIAIIASFLPSLLWLAYWLRRDIHPEPKVMVLRVFFYGMLVAIPILIIEVVYTCLAGFRCPLSASEDAGTLQALYINPFLANPVFFVVFFVGINAFIEEYFKYLAARWGAFKRLEFDEPVDAMVYLIIAALGFATVENIFGSLGALGEKGIQGVFGLLVFRSGSAVLLHALSSGVIGFIIGLSMVKAKAINYLLPRRFWVLMALLVGTLLHALYNYSVNSLLVGYGAEELTLNVFMNAVGPILLPASVLVLLMFRYLNRLSSYY